ncbi:MAG: stage V sporulation protein S [Chloroflexi bacterium]|jgi:stage V sporulation protein S|nr:stage V sporulation protein S [Chloroflexota bacterium]
MDVLKVSSQSKSRALAGAIAGVVRENGRAELQAIGAAAVNQATKAAAIARAFLELDGLDIVLIPTFTQVMIGDQEKTAVRFIVETRHPGV